MRIKKAILSGAGAVALLFGGLTVTAGAASAAPNNDPGTNQCSTLIYQLSSDQDELHFWQMQRAQDAGHGVSTGHDDSEIDFYFSQIDQDVQALDDEGC